MLCTHKSTILCQFGLIICHQLTNSYLHQFSTIFGGNCIKASPGIRLYPRATSLALYVPSLLILNTHLFPINLLFSGIFTLSIFLQTPLLIILLISFRIAACQLCLSSSTGLFPVSWNVLGSVGPDVTADIRQVHVSSPP